MDTYGYLCILMDNYGYLWILMAPSPLKDRTFLPKGGIAFVSIVKQGYLKKVG